MKCLDESACDKQDGPERRIVWAMVGEGNGKV